MRTFTYGELMADPGTNDYLEVPRVKFQSVMQLVATLILFDEDWYLQHYPDVKEAVMAGKFTSGNNHYVISGYMENRIPRPIVVDEKWYLLQYPDVAATVNQSGGLITAQSHFYNYGFKEGRQPFQNWSLI